VALKIRGKNRGRNGRARNCWNSATEEEEKNTDEREAENKAKDEILEVGNLSKKQQTDRLDEEGTIITGKM
jgi:hypothetical protein